MWIPIYLQIIILIVVTVNDNLMLFFIDFWSFKGKCWEMNTHTILTISNFDSDINNFVSKMIEYVFFLN